MRFDVMRFGGVAGAVVVVGRVNPLSRAQVRRALRRHVARGELCGVGVSERSDHDVTVVYHPQALAKMFDLPMTTMHSIVSKMMFTRELHAAWDQPSGTIVMHRVEPTRFQARARTHAARRPPPPAPAHDPSHHIATPPRACRRWRSSLRTASRGSWTPTSAS